jgi:hypothetical protein
MRDANRHRPEFRSTSVDAKSRLAIFSGLLLLAPFLRGVGCGAPNSNQNLANPGAPVYNAIFSPTRPQSKAVLFDEQKTQVRFSIGPQQPGSALSNENWTVNPRLLTSKSNLPLEITMSCAFCNADGGRLQTRISTYFGKEKRSTEVVFDFVPLKSLVKNKNGNAQIGFEVSSRGVQYDRIMVDLQVVDASEIYGTTTAPHTDHGEASVGRPSWAREVDLTIRCSTVGNHITVQLQPGNDSVTQLFEEKHLSKSGELRVFTTNLNANEIPNLVGRAYLHLKGSIEGNPALLQALSGSPGVRAPITSVMMSPADGQVLLKVFFASGADLYRRIFVEGPDTDLRDLMGKFDSFTRTDRQVRIRIETDGLYLPWQFLHPPGSVGAEHFWGFRYELSVNPLTLAIQEPYLGPLQYKQGPLVFGQYRDGPADEVAELGNHQAKMLSTDIGIKGVIIANSRDQFLDALNRNRSTVQMIVTYTHALSGTVVKEDQGRMIVQEDAAGPRILFANNEFLPAQELADMRLSLPTDQRTLFANQPLIFLNGCETGTAGFYATTNLDFPGTFLELGSRGVISTEAPVWTMFGYSFGNSILSQLKTGEPVPLIMVQTRKQFWDQSNNPLGLLYSYYGGSDVRLKIP